MADTITANFGLTLVEVGSSTDTWGSKLNANFSSIAALFGVNGKLLVSVGGTGAGTAAGARTSFGLGTGDSPTFTGLFTTGAATFASAGVTGALTVGTTLAVTGSAAFSSSVTASGLIFTQGATGGFVVSPRDGSGTSFNIYNPTGDALHILGNGVEATMSAAGLFTLPSLTVTGAAAFNGATTIGDVSGDTLTVTATATFGQAIRSANGLLLGVDASNSSLIYHAGEDQIGFRVGGASASFFATLGLVSAYPGLYAPSGDFALGGPAGTIGLRVSDTQTLLHRPMAYNTQAAPIGTLDVGFRGAPRNSQAGAYTLALTDAGGLVWSASGGNTYTVPTNAASAFPIGTTILVAVATGALSIAASGGVNVLWSGTALTGARTLTGYGMASLLKVDTDTWIISGAGLS